MMSAHGEIVFLKELHRAELGRCYRVTGFVSFINAEKRHCQIVHQGFSLMIDCKLVDFSSLRIDSLCQVIGVLCPISEVSIFTALQ